jgi:malonyl-CoA O-methyltransferase
VVEAREVFELDRGRLRAAFERASAGYESAARLQARVAAELLERLAAFAFEPRVVLDLGAGTGRLTRELKRRYPRALVIALDLAP